MADNVRGGSTDAGLPLIATDDVGGVQFQKVKLDVGGDGASVPVVGALPVDASGAAVPVTDNGGALTVDGSVGVTGTVTVEATDLDIRDLDYAADSVEVGAVTGDVYQMATRGTVSLRDFGEGGPYGLMTSVENAVQVMNPVGGTSLSVTTGTTHDQPVFQPNVFAVGSKASSSQPVAVDAGDYVFAYFDPNGYQHVKVDRAPVSGTGTKSSVSASASSVTVLAANADRLGATIANDSSVALYLDLSGGTATTSSFTVKLAADAYYEVPFGYVGAITGVWASATGSARVTEFEA